jgi:hypothetical protein
VCVGYVAMPDRVKTWMCMSVIVHNYFFKALDGKYESQIFKGVGK